MRQDVIDYINTLSLGGFLISNELPWTDTNTPLWLKNPKTIYVDVDNYTHESQVIALNGLTINIETDTVRVYFSCDAKQLPANYETLVQDLKDARSISPSEGFNRREVDVSTSMESDLLVTELEFRYIKITT